MNLKNFFKELTESESAAVSMTEKQISIMSAAIEIFAEKGYSATTTSEIAKRAGVGEGTIFHHYKTKKDLLLAIPDYLSKSPGQKGLMDELLRIFERPYERFEDFLRDIAYNRRDFVAKNIPLIKVLIQEIALQPELREKASVTVLFPAMEKFSRAIERFQARGQIIDIPSVSVSKLIFTSLFGYFFTLYIAAFAFSGDREQDLEYLIGYILHGLGIADTSVNHDPETGGAVL